MSASVFINKCEYGWPTRLGWRGCWEKPIPDDPWVKSAGGDEWSGLWYPAIFPWLGPSRALPLLLLLWLPFANGDGVECEDVKRFGIPDGEGNGDVNCWDGWSWCDVIDAANEAANALWCPTGLGDPYWGPDGGWPPGGGLILFSFWRLVEYSN